MASITVIGANGYAGGELVRFLLQHPHVDQLVLVDKCVEKPTPLGEIFPYLRGATDLMLLAAEPADDRPDLVFFATPDGVAMRLAPAYLERGIRVVDFSGDSRLKTVETYKAWYGLEHLAPTMPAQAVYGLPELFREQIRKARLVANPGCYPTTNILGLAPAIQHGLIERTNIVCDSKSGLSGAGRHAGLAFHLPEMHTDFFAYKIAEHKHTPEIELALGDLIGGAEVRVTFTPQVLPISRGILSTIYGELLGSQSREEVEALYREFYRDAPFVRILGGAEVPHLKHVKGGNFCDLAVRVDDRTGRLIVISALDNLAKGASSQAVQNMNLMLGFEETAGLLRGGFYL